MKIKNNKDPFNNFKTDENAVTYTGKHENNTGETSDIIRKIIESYQKNLKQ